MSWHYLQGQEEAFWEGNCLDGAPSALLKLIPMRAESCLLDRLTDALTDSQSGTTCGPSTGSDGAERSMSSAVDFRVRTSAQPVEERESLGRGLGFGPRWHALSVMFDHGSWSWKTARCLFQEDLPWSSVILPRWGMMRAGECWERNTSELPIKDTGSGLWPTPVADGDRTTNYAQGGTSLGFAARNWPTPTCHDRKGASGAKRGKGATGGPCLTMVIGGTLSPMWVEWLMGWPVGWTDCAVLETDKFRQWLDLHGKH